MKRRYLPLALATLIASISFFEYQSSASAAPGAAAAPPASQPAATRGARGGRGARGPAVATPPIKVTADHPDWNYLPGQPVKFTVQLPPGTAFTYTIGLEMMPLPSKEAVMSASGTMDLDGGTLNAPGFLRLTVNVAGVNFETASNLATAAFSPEKIKPTQTEPADFDAFWNKAKAELAALPIDAKLTPMLNQSTDTVDVFEVSLQNIGDTPGATSRFYGVLSVPKGPGPFPAMMSPPGAGVRTATPGLGWADRGYVTLSVGVHDIPVLDHPEIVVPPRPSGDYPRLGLEDANSYCFRRIYMGCLRANDFLMTHPKVDKNKLVAKGGSQGGMLSIITAGLDPRVKIVCASFPAYCDVSGYVHGRAGGWPGLRFDDMADPLRDKKIANTAYFDTVNFAKRVKVPGHYGWGYNDATCPPDSTFSMYNSLTAPKKLAIFKEMGHPRVQGLTDAETAFVLEEVAKLK